MEKPKSQSTQSAQKALHPIEASALHARRERVFLLLAGIFLGSMTMLNILGISRFIRIYELPWELSTGETWNIMFAVAIGVLPYPATFLCTDFISEFYGRRRANWLVTVGLILNLWVIFILWIGGLLPGAFEGNTNSQGIPLDANGSPTAFFQIRALSFGAVAASMIAYMAAQFCDVYLFHFWKNLTRGKHLWLRNNGSTLVSQLVDSIAVILITHFFAVSLTSQANIPDWIELTVLVLTSYAFKLIVAMLDTIPFYIGVGWLKNYLQFDPAMEHEPNDVP